MIIQSTKRPSKLAEIADDPSADVVVALDENDTSPIAGSSFASIGGVSLSIAAQQAALDGQRDKLLGARLKVADLGVGSVESLASTAGWTMPGGAETALDVVGVVTAGTGLWQKMTDDDPDVLDVAISTGKMVGRVADLLAPMVPFLHQHQDIIKTTTLILSGADAVRDLVDANRSEVEANQRLVALTVDNAELLAAHGVT